MYSLKKYRYYFKVKNKCNLSLYIKKTKKTKVPIKIWAQLMGAQLPHSSWSLPPGSPESLTWQGGS